MAEFTFNPYPEIGSQLTDGLELIARTIDADSTVDDLANTIYKFIQPIYYPVGEGETVAKQLEIEIKSVVYNMANVYNNKGLVYSSFYLPQQYTIINMMLGATTTDHTPINALDKRFLDIEDNISKADMTIDQQTPLLLTMECAKSIYAYWVDKTSKPGEWNKFFEKAAAANYANIPLWTVACMEGSLLGANASQKGLIAPTTDITSVNIISSLIGALTIGAGKVIFKWVPRIQPEQLNRTLSLNKELISGLENEALAGRAGGGRLSIFNWVDCGAHSPHWCNTVCAQRAKKSRNVDGDNDAEECFR